MAGRICRREKASSRTAVSRWGGTASGSIPRTLKYVSLLNLESIADLEKILGAAVDPIRFRGNFYFDGVPAWRELDWVGQEVTIGDARLKVVSPTKRCAATTVNPATGERDLNIPRTLQLSFGHVHMGLYAEVVTGGEIVEDAVLEPGSSAPMLA